MITTKYPGAHTVEVLAAAGINIVSPDFPSVKMIHEATRSSTKNDGSPRVISFVRFSCGFVDNFLNVPIAAVSQPPSADSGGNCHEQKIELLRERRAVAAACQLHWRESANAEREPDIVWPMLGLISLVLRRQNGVRLIK